MKLNEKIHVFENSRLVTDHFKSEALTAAYVEALAALYKQSPNKVIFNSEKGREYEDYICPHCKDILQQRRKGTTQVTITHFAYCHNCGQALDWRVEEC